MPRVPVAQLGLNMRLKKQPFLLRDFVLRPLRNDQTLLLVTLADSTGAIGGAMHNAPTATVNALRDAQGVEVTGYISAHRDRLQVTLERIEPVELSGLQDFLPTARRSMEEMVAELDALLADITDADLERLLSAFFDDPEIRGAFIKAPAAKRFHHAYIGGLLEHTLAVARIVITAADLYPEMDRDLAITIALLHDIGKVRAYDPVTFDLTEEGVLFNHLSVSAMMVSEAISAIQGFDEELRLRVIHGVLAHHGELDRGSPVRPRTLEAMVVHYADNLDGDAQGAIDHLERSDEAGGHFTERSMMHEGELYRGRR